MKLNHINLTVPDVAMTRAFFEDYFDFHCVMGQKSNTFAGLVDDAGLFLALNNFSQTQEVAYPKWFHIGFAQESDEQVNEIHARLKRGGLAVGEPKNFHGAWTFYFEAPGGIMVEVLHQRTTGEQES